MHPCYSGRMPTGIKAVLLLAFSSESLRDLLMDSAQACAWLSMHNSHFIENVICFNTACCAFVFRGGRLHADPAAGRVLPVLQCNGLVHSQWCALLWFTVRPA